MQRLTLKPLFGGDVGSIEVRRGTTTIVGRGRPASVADKRCSRKQLEITISAAAAANVAADDNAKSGVTAAVKAHGVNPSAVFPQGNKEKRVFLIAGDTAVLRAGDHIALLCDGTFEFEVVVSDAAPKAAAVAQVPVGDAVAPAAAPAIAQPKAQWMWLGDMKWEAYGKETCAVLERAYSEGRSECAVDAERVVDLVAMEQKRRDDPGKRRNVRRIVGAAPASSEPPTVHYVRRVRVPEKRVIEKLEAMGAVMSPVMGGKVTHVLVHQDDAANGESSDAIDAALESGKHVVSTEWALKSAAQGRFLPEGDFQVKANALGQPPGKKKSPAPAAGGDVSSYFGGDGGGGGKHEAVWFWRRDDGGWQKYEKAVSDRIEKAYRIQGPDAPRQVKIDGARYIDLFMLKQRHYVSDDLERDVKRETA